MENEELDIPVLRIDRAVEEEQSAFVKKIKADRDSGAVQASLEKLRKAAEGNGNTFEAILEAVKTYATVGEISDVFRDVWGEYVEPASAMQVS